MMSYRHTMKASTDGFLFLCLPVISSTNTGIEDHSNVKQSSSPIAPESDQSTPSTNPVMKHNSKAKQSSPLPKIPMPGKSFYDVKTKKDKNYVIVDKTDFIKKLVDNDDITMPHKIYFLSRPKAFGKTFFLSTIRAFLDGDKKLFKYTTIYSRGNWLKGNGKWQKNSVIFIDFN